ncbi:hypothetical protein SRHO_G00014030 [Serrasalmus rhombeus]
MCLLGVLLALSCWSNVDGCTWMKSNFHILNNRAISHLQQAAKSHVVFILRTLKNVMRLYEKSENADCDQQKLQTFILDLHRQITELERCDYSAAGWKDVAGLVLQHLYRLDLLAISTKLDPSL